MPTTNIRAHPRRGTRGVRRHVRTRITVALTPHRWRGNPVLQRDFDAAKAAVGAEPSEPTMAFVDMDNPGIIFINEVPPSHERVFEENISGIISHETLHDVLQRYRLPEASERLDYQNYQQQISRGGMWPRARRRRR